MTKKTDSNAFKASWSYDAAPESTDHIQIKKQYDLFIDGEFSSPVDGHYFETMNPSNHELISTVADASSKDVDKAVIAAGKAFKKWSVLPGKERGKYIFRIARLIQERARELAVIESLDG